LIYLNLNATKTIEKVAGRRGKTSWRREKKVGGGRKNKIRRGKEIWGISFRNRINIIDFWMVYWRSLVRNLIKIDKFYKCREAGKSSR